MSANLSMFYTGCFGRRCEQSNGQNLSGFVGAIGGTYTESPGRRRGRPGDIYRMMAEISVISY